MKNALPLLLAVLPLLGTSMAAHTQDEVHTVWVQRNGSGPQPFFFGYGRTPEIAERLAFNSCGRDCTILKSGPGCLSITMGGQEFPPQGCRIGALPEAPQAPPEAPEVPEASPSDPEV